MSLSGIIDRIEEESPNDLRNIYARFGVVAFLVFMEVVFLPLWKLHWLLLPLLFTNSISLFGNVLYFLLAVKRGSYERRVYIATFFDLLSITIAIHFLGGITTNFSWVYAIALIVIALLEGMKIGIYVAVLSSLMNSGLMVLEWSGIVDTVNLGVVKEDLILNNELHLFLRLLSDNVLFYATALVTGALSSGLIKKRKELEQEIEERKEEISLRKQTEEKLQVSERHYRLLADNITDIIWTLDIATLRSTYTSPSVETLFGYTAEEATDFPLSDILTPPSMEIATGVLQEELAAVLGGEDPPISRTLELEHRCKNGSTKWCESKVSFLQNPDGKNTSLVGVTRDITEHRRAEREKAELEAHLQRAEKMEALGILAGGVAHDLNNILSAIVGFPELLLLDLPEDSRMRTPLLTIKRSGQKAATIVQDMLMLARSSVQIDEVLNLNDVISEYLDSPECGQMKAYHPGVQLVTRLETDLLKILGSPVHLSKVVMNLVSNAAEAMPGGGEVTIRTENRSLDRPVKGYETVDEGDYVVLTVSDTGVGLSPEDMEKIFEPFYSKKALGRRGTGLGAAVVWRTVKDHRGFIDLQNREGNGITFTVFFPVTREEQKTGKSSLYIDDFMGNGESILVVDDVKEQRELAVGMLKRLGYSAVSVSSGEEAVEYMRANSVHLVILDMIMDPGIDGFETYKRILDLHPGQKAIIASGYSETDRVYKAQELGVGTYIRKPYTMERIGTAIKSELQS